MTLIHPDPEQIIPLTIKDSSSEVLLRVTADDIDLLTDIAVELRIKPSRIDISGTNFISRDGTSYNFIEFALVVGRAFRERAL